MSLDEFFAKKAKAKTKKKQTPKDLMKKLMNNDVQKDTIEANLSDSVAKTSYAEVSIFKILMFNFKKQATEWEILDDELELDSEALKLNKLIIENEEQTTDNKYDRGNDGDNQQEKKAWGSKSVEGILLHFKLVFNFEK